MIKLIQAIIAIACMAMAALGQEAQSSAAEAGIHGAGKWKTEGKAQKPKARWSLNALRFENNELRGRVAVADSPIISTANFEGRIEGQAVSGTISDDAGEVLATFEGTVSKSGIQGKYKDRTGEVGDWQWEGQLPSLVDAIAP